MKRSNQQFINNFTSRVTTHKFMMLSLILTLSTLSSSSNAKDGSFWDNEENYNLKDAL